MVPKINIEEGFADIYIKQVISGVLNHKLHDNQDMMKEAKEKAITYKHLAVGAYSESKGLAKIRENLKSMYQDRDGYPISEEEIYLIAGSVNAYNHAMTLMSIVGDCVFIPSPISPVLLNVNKLYGVENVFYNFKGIENGKPGKIDLEDLSSTISKLKAEGKNLKCMVISNPQMPLGKVMSEEEMIEVVKFCEENRLVMVVVESWQDIVYDKNDEGKKFISFRRIINQLKSPVELMSIRSISYSPFFM